jgi:hypothetical protein
MGEKPLETLIPDKRENKKTSIEMESYKNWAEIEEVFNKEIKKNNIGLYDTENLIKELRSINREDLIDPYLINRFFQNNRDFSTRYINPKIVRQLNSLNGYFSFFVENSIKNERKPVKNEKDKEGLNLIKLSYKKKGEMELIIADYIKNKEEYRGKLYFDIMDNPEQALECFKKTGRQDLIDSYLIFKMWDCKNLIEIYLEGGNLIGSEEYKNGEEEAKKLFEPLVILLRKFEGEKEHKK